MTTFSDFPIASLLELDTGRPVFPRNAHPRNGFGFIDIERRSMHLPALVSRYHRVLYLETLGNVEDIIRSNPGAKFIVTGDFNYDISDNSQPMCSAINSFLNSFNLVSTHTLDSSYDQSSSYTRCCIKSSRYSMLDYIFISRSLVNRVSGCKVDYLLANI